VHTDTDTATADVNNVFRDCYRASFSLNFDLFDDTNSNESDNNMFP